MEKKLEKQIFTNHTEVLNQKILISKISIFTNFKLNRNHNKFSVTEIYFANI